MLLYLSYEASVILLVVLVRSPFGFFFFLECNIQCPVVFVEFTVFPGCGNSIVGYAMFRARVATSWRGTTFLSSIRRNSEVGTCFLPWTRTSSRCSISAGPAEIFHSEVTIRNLPRPLCTRECSCSPAQSLSWRGMVWFAVVWFTVLVCVKTNPLSRGVFVGIVLP